MLSQGFNKVLTPKAKFLNIIWGAFMMAPVFYSVVAWIMFGKSATGELVWDADFLSGDPRLTISVIIALLALGASVYAERVMLSPARLQENVRKYPQFTDILPIKQGGMSQQSPALESIYNDLPETEKRLASLFVAYQTALIVNWALREAVVVVGLVVAIMCTSFTTVLPFAAVSMIALGLKVPRPTSFFEKNKNVVKLIV